MAHPHLPAPYVPYTGNYAVIKPIYSMRNRHGVSVLNYLPATWPTTTLITKDMASAWWTSVSAEFGVIRGEEWFVQGVECRIRANGIVAAGNFFPTPPAAVVADCLPNMDSVMLALGTNYAGRTGKGRVFLPPPTEGNTDGPYVTPGAMVYYDALGAKLLAGFTYAGVLWRPQVLSRRWGQMREVTVVSVRARIARLSNRSPLF